MKKENRTKLKLLVFSQVVLFFSVGILFVSSTQLQKIEFNSGSDQVKVSNSVEELEVVGTSLSGPKFVVTVRNNSQKVINNFYVSSGQESWQVELIYSDVRDSVMPASSFDITVPVGSSLYVNGVAIRAILFNDNSGAGEVEFQRIMRDRRRGEKQELKKGRMILEEFDLASKISKEKLSQIKVKFTSSPQSEETSESKSVELGINLGRQRFLRALERIENVAEISPSGVEFEYKQLIARLRRYESKL